MNDLLTILNLSDWNMNNTTLRGHLRLLNHSQSNIPADALRNLRMLAKKEYEERRTSKKPLVLAEKDLKLVLMMSLPSQTPV